MEIVLNEMEWVEEKIGELSLGDQPRITLKRYAILLHSRGYEKEDIRRHLEDFILRCLPSANKLHWSDIVDWAVKECDSRELFRLNEIIITDSELEAISEIDGTMKEKVLFTLLCLAKYRNAINAKNNGWVNYPVIDVFRLANVDVSRKRRMLILHELCQKGVIGYSKLIDNTNVQVKIIQNEAEPAVSIKDFRNIGNQYMRLITEDYMECSECGIVIRRSRNGRQKLCRKCAEEANRVNSAKRYYSHIA